jgi:tRNA-intron endonuclease
MKKIQATLIKNQVTSNSSEAHALFQKSRFGEKLNQKILYSTCETLFLVQENKMEVFDFQDKPLLENVLIKKLCQLDKNFLTKYPVFKDLREKGCIVKTALKFGSVFRVYEKESKVGKSHSKWLCFPVLENKSTNWQDFTAKNRVAHSSKKNLLIAILDEENKISYFEIKWIKI